jgi:hypothetical protein
VKRITPDISVTTPTSCATVTAATVDHGGNRWDASLMYASPSHMMTREVKMVVIPKSK